MNTVDAVVKQMNDCVSNPTERDKLLNFINDCKLGIKNDKIFVLCSSNGGLGKSTLMDMVSIHLGNGLYRVPGSFFTKNSILFEECNKEKLLNLVDMKDKLIIFAEEDQGMILDKELINYITSCCITPFGINFKNNFVIATNSLDILNNIDHSKCEIIHFDKLKYGDVYTFSGS